MKFTSHWTRADYSKHANDLIESPVASSPDLWASGQTCAFVCHDTLKDSQNKKKTAKRSTGETRSEKDTAYRICKYRLNPSLYLYADELYTTDGTPVTDYNLAENFIFEVVYYAPEAHYSGTALQYVKYENKLLSYFPKHAEGVFTDLSRVHTDVSHEKFRAFANKVDPADLIHYPKNSESELRQPVNIVLEFDILNNTVATRATFYNNEASAQAYLSNKETAFFACLFSGNNYQM